MSDVQTAEILDAAAALIEPEGAWMAGAYFMAGGERRWFGDAGLERATARSMDAAVNQACGYLTDGRVPPSWNEVHDLVAGVLPENQDITSWNDEPGRTQADVVAKLREAASLARGEDVERCIACLVPFKEGDRYLPDESGGSIHFDCCGTEREGFTRNGEPLGPDDPIPTPYVWHAALPTPGEQP